jgi:hypothetical protein
VFRTVLNMALRIIVIGLLLSSSYLSTIGASAYPRADSTPFDSGAGGVIANSDYATSDPGSYTDIDGIADAPININT